MKFTGISAYASMHPAFPVKRFLRQFPDDIRHPAISILSGSFGWDETIIQEFTTRFMDRPHLIEVFLANGCARRRGRGEAGDMAGDYSIAKFNRALTSGEKKLRDIIEKRIKRIEKTIFAYGGPNTLFVLALELEDNMSDAAAENFVGLVRKFAPGVKVLRNPLKGGTAQGSADFIEHHAGKPSYLAKGQFYNMDGYSVDFDDGEDFFQGVSLEHTKELLDRSKSFATFIWSARQQGFPVGFDGWQNTPPKRSRKFVVTNKAIEGSRWLLSGKGE